ncbi:ArnT family glycosyltransferase [Anabaena subtropica]|uniref:Glycosyltransferase family 39 protein n=1 Tax=Anabaena subtropica FACHB-260 TaxID=2692884 RepID=A0ABR8CJK6_9NOST|nr:glycosyltransferase family 39 protein [Anabaena subtropica]MBD2343412.1 glycosyltransferase family 39 protein [Anabaena subtropica FACHB-260]
MNDDWAYGWSVKILLETGDFQLSDWTATNLLPQVFWGALFCLPFGFSFTALRFSTLTLGVIGVITTYLLLREVNSSPKSSLLGALTVAFNPLYFVLSNSFMSDVPSLTFTILSLYFLIRGLNKNSNIEIIIGIFLSFISILNRQLAIVIMPAFSLAYLIKKDLEVKTYLAALTPSIFGIALYLSYSHWLRLTERLPLLYSFQGKQLLESFSRNLIEIIAIYSKNLLIISIYLGLFLFPLLIVRVSIEYKILSLWQKRISISCTYFIVAVVSVYFLVKRLQMPLVGNVLDSFSLGLQALDGYNAFLKPTSRFIISAIWQILTLVGVVGAALLFQCLLFAIFQIFSLKTDLNRKYLLILTISSTVLYLLPIAALKDSWFDRYLILCLPFLLIFISIKMNNVYKNKPSLKAVIICLVMLIFCGGFTITATHDYLSWNRVRWQAINDLMQESQISPHQINGGFEFNGWYFGNRLEICNPEYQQNTQQTSINWGDFTCLWGQGEYKYTVSFVPKAAYELEKEYSFKRWLPWRDEKLFVLRKVI